MVGRRRPNPDVYEDPVYDWKKHDPGLADDLRDMILQKDNYAPSTTGPDQAERDKLEHEQRIFMVALRDALTDQLKGQDIHCNRVSPDGYGQGFFVQCRDKNGRIYDAHLSFDEGIAIGHERGETMGREIIDLLAKRILEARERYFLRMQ